MRADKIRSMTQNCSKNVQNLLKAQQIHLAQCETGGITDFGNFIEIFLRKRFGSAEQFSIGV